MMQKSFSVSCVAEIDNHIGAAQAHIIGDGPTDWYIDSITNKYCGEISGEFISGGLYEEIAAEVADYFEGAPT